MKKSVISLSIAAMIGGLGFASGALAAGSVAGDGTTLLTTTATTLQFAEGDIGHMLLVPYFTTQGGNVTLLNITNTDTVNGKAVKIRFRGAGNSDDILDFQIFMSPGDVWTAQLTQDATSGLSRLETSDTTCTIPAIPAGGVEFITERIAPNDALFDAARRALHTREGYIEIFNMADIPLNYTVGATDAGKSNALYTAIKHANGTPNNCNAAAVTGLWDGTVALATAVNLADAGFDTPTTGLMGTSTIINTQTGFVAWSANADAIVATTAAGADARGRVVYSRQTGGVIGNTAARLLTNDPLLRLPTTDPRAVTALEWDFPDMSTPYVGTGTTVVNGIGAGIVSPENQTEMLTFAIAKASVSNEYLTTASIGAKTDWAFTMPTRRYHVVTAYANTGLSLPPSAVFHALPSTETEANPSTWFDGTIASVTTSSTSEDYSLLCVDTGAAQPLAYYDREENTTTTGPDFSPGTRNVMRFCAEASVLSFNAPSEVLYAAIGTRRVDLNYVDGWARLNTTGLGNGLPILGAAYTKMVGLPQNGNSTNYGQIMPHRF